MYITLDINTIAIKVIEFADCLVHNNDSKSVSLMEGIKKVFEVERILRQTDEEIMEKLDDSISETESLSSSLSESVGSSSESGFVDHKYGISFCHFIYKDNVYTSWNGSLGKIETAKKTDAYKDFKAKGGVIVRSKSRMLRYIAQHRKCMHRANRKFRNWLHFYGM